MHPHVIVAVKRQGVVITHVVLESGSVLTQDDCECFIKAGCEFVTKDADGSTSKVVVVEGAVGQHLRTVKNDVTSDNLSSLPEA